MNHIYSVYTYIYEYACVCSITNTHVYKTDQQLYQSCQFWTCIDRLTQYIRFKLRSKVSYIFLIHMDSRNREWYSKILMHVFQTMRSSHGSKHRNAFSTDVTYMYIYDACQPSIVSWACVRLRSLENRGPSPSGLWRHNSKIS